MPVLEALLQPGESLISEAGELSWMTQTIAMTTHTQMAGGGGIFGAIKRVAGGGTLFMTEYTAQGYQGEVAFAAKIPGHILPIEVGPGHEFMIHRHGFLCATPQIQLGVGFQQSLGAGIFGGDGFLLQKVSGVGTAWLELGGEVVVRDLQAGETVRELPDHANPGDSEHVLWRRWHLPGGDDRAGPYLAADAAAGEPGACSGTVSAVGTRRGEECGDGGSAGRDRREHVRQPVTTGGVIFHRLSIFVRAVLQRL
jgi:uncharacterized protein (AIM24 family)